MPAPPRLATLTTVATVANAAFYVGPLRRLLARLGPPAQPPPGQAPLPPSPLSLVIAARDEAANLRAHLPAVLAQAYPGPLGVVVVDDASADATPEVLAQAARTSPRLRVATVHDKTAPGKKQALALALTTATHDWLLATDADCAPTSPHWATVMMAARRADTELVLGYGPYRRRPGWLNAWIRYETVYTAAQYLTAALAGRPYMGVGRNLLYHRRLYERAGGFAAHAHLAGGDDDLLVNAAALARTTAVCLHPDARVYSEPKRTWRAYFRQKTRHLSVSHAYKRTDQRWLGALAASHFGHYAGVGALLATGRWRWAVVLYGARQLAVTPRMAAVARGLGEADLARRVPLLDFGVGVYYVAFAAGVLWGRLRGRASREW